MNNQEQNMKISKEKLLEIYKEEYLNGISTVKLGVEYDLSAQYFSRWFHKLGLEMRSNKINSKQYSVNDNYFENIDTSEKAYWLGFIYADGYVSCLKNSKRVGMALSTKDEAHIQSFCNCINSNNPIHRYDGNGYGKGFQYSRVLINSSKMYDDLISHGVFEKKSSILLPPKLNEEFIKYFILGYFDGDGSIYLNNSKYPSYTISFVGTDDICNYVSEYFLNNNLILKKATINKRKDEQIVSYIRWGGNKIVNKIMSHLYNGMNLDICLKRKHDLYMNCKNKQTEQSFITVT